MAVVALAVESPAWPSEADLEPLVERAVAAAIASAERVVGPSAEISIVLGDDTLMRRLNRDWRAKDKPTNVLSFPAVEPARLATAPLLGDVVLGYETVAAEARSENKPLEHHLAHLVVHGVLHCLGFDHETDAEATDMERRETRALATLAIPDPYADSQPTGP